MEHAFCRTGNDKYGAGALLQDYKGEWFLVAAHVRDDGVVKMRWCHPQGPGNFIIPWQIKLGDSAQEAFDTLAYFGKILKDKL